jgi:phage shock protein PspC (stress-responsive transcriptional regulator)
MIAGVCGGLGRHLDIDPVVFRIMFVVLTFFGGLGLLVYAALWLFVPVDGERESEAQRLLTGSSALAAVAITVVLVLGFMAMVGTISDGFGRAVPLLVVAAAIVAVLVWRNESRRPIAPEQGRSEFTEAASGARDWGTGGDPRPKSWWQRPVSAHPAPGTSTGSISAAEYSSGLGQSAQSYSGTTESRGSAERGAAAADYGVGWSGTAGYGTAWPGASGYGASWPQAGGYGGASMSGVGTDPAEGEPNGQVTRGRRMSGVALSGILVAVGILGVLAAGGAIHIGWSAGFALTVMAIGAGMMIGGLYGRTRWLIPVGLVLAIPLIVGNALGVPLRGETGNVDWTPGSVAAATASTYELAAGKGSLDLSAVNPAGGVAHVTAHIGAGRLTVTVPRNVEVQLTAHVGAGEIQFVDGTKENGLDVTRTVDAGPIGTSQGTIALNLRVGTGIVEVDRVNG